MDTFFFNYVIIGAGVVGLAVARELASRSDRVLLIEKAKDFGSGISSRSSEVIHSGIYYKEDSLKAKLCVAGNKALYEYCNKHSIPHKNIGKIIVAVDQDEMANLLEYKSRGENNGVHQLELLSHKALARAEPEVRGVAGLYCPSTGIVDSHALMAALLRDFESLGGTFVRQAPLISGQRLDDDRHILLELGGSNQCYLKTPGLVNCAGLDAQAVAKTISGFPSVHVPPIHYAAGQYYVLSGKVPFNHLIYPVASKGGLGIHLTLDLGRSARFGPDIRWLERIDYAFDDNRRELFIETIRRYWPDLPAHKLTPGYVGIRPKLWGPSSPEQDFLIQGPKEHGVHGLVNLFGIESPGLTSALAISTYVSDLVTD